jgi:hypothetical protein
MVIAIWRRGIDSFQQRLREKYLPDVRRVAADVDAFLAVDGAADVRG